MSDDTTAQCRKIIRSQGYPGNLVEVLSSVERTELLELGKAGFHEFLGRRQRRIMEDADKAATEVIETPLAKDNDK